ncbi:bacillithiol system protein YtxJ [Niabella ginsenosidivorans]|uniref:Bacillithiol system protein YtxJ n=1 Tax=Niabella ginsenosidivorans TaxID=1176587 RepID=A0A1A9I1Q9_9BACT|nr:bacillithiol system redox-active protein YtxJ [Niabella ginsenosidivorans]ANH80641.1 bacillithiol system protein YtxJ [Niabella ginsenosidivorans]
MNWNILEREEQLEQIDTASAHKPQLIFKHSTRCSISTVIKSRLNKKELPPDIDFYFLDLIAHRAISNQIAERYGIRHESPQILLIKNGKCIFTESHNAIFMEDIIDEAQK